MSSGNKCYGYTIFALIVLMAIVGELKAQARIGSSATDIIREFSDKNLKWDRMNDGTKYLWCDDDRISVYYIMDEKSVCQTTYIIPNNQGVVNYYCEKFNKEAVIISDTQWKLYTNGGVLYIKLIYPESGGYLFMLY